MRILDTDIDPKGESTYQVVFTNGFDTNTPPNPILATNFFYTPIPTNAVYNFMKANFRVTRDATNWWKGTPITVYVNRSGTNTGSSTIYWRVGGYFLDDVETLQNIYFPRSRVLIMPRRIPPTTRKLMERFQTLILTLPPRMAPIPARSISPAEINGIPSRSVLPFTITA